MDANTRQGYSTNCELLNLVAPSHHEKRRSDPISLEFGSPDFLLPGREGAHEFALHVV